MASVFLSYDRDDSAAAKVIATSLEQAGHSVWWDLHVRGGAQFAKVIEEALKASDAVVVLWSKDSIDSAWVRDEATAGRDSGRLIPASIDATEAPLGFRQFQTIDLRDWKKGARSAGYRQVEAAIGELGSPDSTPASEKQESARHLRGRIVALAAVPLIAVIIAALYLLRPPAADKVPTVTVVPASTTPVSQALSRDLLAKLGVLQASNGDALQLVDEGSGKVPELIFKVDGSNEAGAAKATLLLLSGETRALLWSSAFEQASGNSSDLKQQLAYSAANVLDCASDAYGADGRSLDEQTRRLYLKGCGDFLHLFGPDTASLVSTFREITRRAPQFEPAWALLIDAEDEAYFSPTSNEDSPTALTMLKADIASARKIRPTMAEAYDAEADILASERFVKGLPLIELGAEKNPDNADALGQRSFAFLNVGRLNDAVSDARRAVQIRPFSPRLQEQYISALIYAGQLDAARHELARAEALFPGASILREARYRLDSRYGSAEDALKQVQRGEVPTFPGQESFLKARISRNPANVARALEDARRSLNDTSVPFANYLQAVAEFGTTDELIEFLLRLSKADQRGAYIGVTFRPAFRAFWRDPRSMVVAAQYGLVDYWRRSGHWPDFCFEPDLPYDCKKEAAKLAA